MEQKALTRAIADAWARRRLKGDHRLKAGSLGERRHNDNYAARMSYIERHRR